MVLVRRLARALRLFPTINEGRHVAEPEVVVHRAREVRLASPATHAGVLVDGEFHGALPLTIRCRAAALEVIAPQ